MTSPSPLALEERSLNAWPALQTLCYDGWLLRLSAGYTRRANSVNALYPGELDPAEKIAHCAARYRVAGLRPVFKVTSATGPAGLDGLLESRGYRREAPTSVQVLPLAPPAPTPGREREATAQPRRSPAPSPGWIDAFCRLSGADPGHRGTMARLLAAVPPPRCFLALRQDGETVATGLAVLERGCAGILDVAVDPARRRRGLGTALMRHLLSWAGEQGGRYAYLQVVAGNVPAVRLYAALGFREAYTYWYRVLE